MTKSLHLFRHGLTDWNVARRLQGHTDIPLNDEGKSQALELQKYFTQNPVSIFLSSDLMRAQQTASLANSVLQKPLHTTPALRESFMGALEGRTREEALEIYGQGQWEQWSSIKPEHADFRFPGAESARETVVRALAALRHFCETHEFESAGVCTHGLVMRRLLHAINPHLKKTLNVPNCVVYQIEYQAKTRDFRFYFNE